MPLVRIDLPATVSATEAAAVSRAVHQSLVDVFHVPKDDLFQVVARRAPGEIVCSPGFLGIGHSDQVVFVQIACSPGRAVGLKEALYARIARDVARDTAFLGEDVIINLVETARENWSFGRGIAQYAVQDRARPAAAS
jgi:phenylpyruvate tautomerase PptA (4-oxalocrotonate tautomerase family)